MNQLLTILTGDCRETLKTLGDETVHTCVTSPPYYGLRDYGTGEWEGGDPACKHVVGEYRRGLGLATSTASTRGGGHKAAEVGTRQAAALCPHCGAARIDKQIGQEATPEAFIETMVEVFREVRRVLRSDGTLWLNLGDSYANDTKWGGKTSGLHAKDLHGTSGIGRCRTQSGLPGKNLMGIPWRVALALQADGWILRSEIVWYKPNPMPESTTDRPTKSHEQIFLFSKSPRYFYDGEAIKEPVSENTNARVSQNLARQEGSHRANGGLKTNGPMRAVVAGSGRKIAGDGQGKRVEGFEASLSLAVSERNKRDVWEIPEDLLSQFCVWLDQQPKGSKADVWRVATQPFQEAHFATFPPDLIKPCILAGCPTRGKRCDCETLIETPTGDGEHEDPSMLTGRAGMNRPRNGGGGVRAITRRVQRGEARQMKASEHRAAMEELCGPAFAHYIRTDLIGARPLPQNLRDDFAARGWLTEVPPCECPEEPAGVVLDPFGGSGTTGMVAMELGRRAILCELNPEYRKMIDRRCNVTPGFDFTFGPEAVQPALFP